jgi:nitroreductase
MEQRIFLVFIVIFVLLCGCTWSQQAPGTPGGPATTLGEIAPGSATTPATGLPAGSAAGLRYISLPEPRYDSTISVEEALKNRRSVRSFTSDALTIADVSQLLWAAQGKTSGTGQRTAPSAQRVYPLEVYVIAQNVTGLSSGTYHYLPDGHRLEIIRPGDMSSQVPAGAPAAFVIAIDLDKKPAPRPALTGAATAGSTPQANPSAPAGAPVIRPIPDGSGSFREPSEETIPSWYYAEAGHAAENLYLLSGSLGLGMVTPAGFGPQTMGTLLQLKGGVTPFYVIPVGHPA